MKKIIWILFFGVLACGDGGDDFGAPDQLILLSDREVICPGQTATFHLFSLASQAEVPISNFIFDPLPSAQGSISSGGQLTLGSSISDSEITISGTFKSKSKLSTTMKIKSSSSSSQPILEISPFQFYNPDLGRPFYFWPDGSVVLGSGKFGSIYSGQFEVIKYSGKGVLEWKKELGTGAARFVKVLGEKIYAAGYHAELAGAIYFSVLIFDLSGNLIWESKLPTSHQHVFQGFSVDSQGNYYLSTFTNGSSYETSLAKFDPNGKKIWEIEPKTSFEEIFIFPDGNLVAKGNEGLGGEPFLTFFNSTGQLLKKVRIDFSEVTFLGPNNSFGCGYQIQNTSNETHSIYLDLYSSTGQKIVERKRIVADQPYSGKLENPTQKKRAPSGGNKFFTSKSGEVHVLHPGFWGSYDFLNLNSSVGEEWFWWKKNQERTSEEVIYPLQITEKEDDLIVFAHSGGKLFRFRIGKGYAFDECLREPYWNSLDLI